MWTGLAGPSQGQLADACECGNETSGSIKSGGFLDWLQTIYLLKKDLAPWSKYYYYYYYYYYYICKLYLRMRTKSTSQSMEK